jgi:hypothetical protein
MNDLEFIEKEITVKGLKKEYRILHVTDWHIVLSGERDEGVLIKGGYWKGTPLTEYTTLRYKRFTFDGISTAERFSRLCAALRENPNIADAVVFTGDITDCYTPAAFEFMRDNIKGLKTPWMFVIGNHDMIFSNMTEDETRNVYKELTGENTFVQEMTLGELSLVGVYNGPYYYPEKSLCGLEKALDGKENVILFQHVPLPEEDYKGFVSEGEKASINETYATVFEWITKENSPIKAVIAGDNHVESHYMIGNIPQHVSPLASEFAPVLFKIHS